ncbi:hypothetical protein IQ19_00187 [Cytobacillus oceanisediminis]|uniref:Uncharacterized protein n=1 Tax=Cytobacillus oceanisediminis TaxID=665099 RepID=A0A562K5M3_9BACI|nr:hypothetical protein IQ19_00187 [Cytobacillus oceanisediminis]
MVKLVIRSIFIIPWASFRSISFTKVYASCIIGNSTEYYNGSIGLDI